MLLIDDRAGSKELLPYFAGDDNCVSCILDAGDVCVPGNGPIGDVLVGVEVKKIADLLSSETTGRLAGTQMPKLLVAGYEQIWILVIGHYRPGPKGELQVKNDSGWRNYSVGSRIIPYSYIEGFLIELSAFFGVQTKVVSSNLEAVWWIKVLEHWWSKPWDKHKGMKKFDRSHGMKAGMIDLNDPKYRLLMQIAETANSFPTVGWERAWAIAHCFASPFAFMSATPSQLEEVPGIGKVLANSIHRSIHGK